MNTAGNTEYGGEGEYDEEYDEEYGGAADTHGIGRDDG